MRTRILDIQIGLRNSTTRIPFRYGKSCLTRCPQAVLSAQIEIDGRIQQGYSGDCLPPGWFDKDPAKDFRQQIADMIGMIDVASAAFTDEFRVGTRFFEGWRAAYTQVQDEARRRELPSLLASFAVSLPERALLDGLARAAGRNVSALFRDNAMEIDAGQIHPELANRPPASWLPATPARSIWVRHTVGLADPLTRADLTAPLDDGYPETLEQYLQQLGVRYLKVKLANHLDTDIARLHTIAQLLHRYRGDDYRVTLDGNEQYGSPSEFDALVAACRGDQLRIFWRNIVCIEQPLSRKVALDSAIHGAWGDICPDKVVIIDESDERLESFSLARQLGYRGVSSKNCKGPIKSILNAGLVRQFTQSDGIEYIMTGEDLCTVGVIPVQSDLCLAATLGIEHVERNGHHYHPGLAYLPANAQELALKAHPDFYVAMDSTVRPHVRNGRLQVGSIMDCTGYGFAAEPDMCEWTAASQWSYDAMESSSVP